MIWLNGANGTVGYLPPEHLYDADIYQVDRAPFARGCLEQLYDACEHTIVDLKAQVECNQCEEKEAEHD